MCKIVCFITKKCAVGSAQCALRISKVLLKITLRDYWISCHVLLIETIRNI